MLKKYKNWELNAINTKKSECLTTRLENGEKLEVYNEGIKKVNKFRYLESVLESDGKIFTITFLFSKEEGKGGKVISMLNSVLRIKKYCK